MECVPALICHTFYIGAPVPQLQHTHRRLLQRRGGGDGMSEGNGERSPGGAEGGEATPTEVGSPPATPARPVYVPSPTSPAGDGDVALSPSSPAPEAALSTRAPAPQSPSTPASEEPQSARAATPPSPSSPAPEGCSAQRGTFVNCSAPEDGPSSRDGRPAECQWLHDLPTRQAALAPLPGNAAGSAPGPSPSVPQEVRDKAEAVASENDERRARDANLTPVNTTLGGVYYDNSCRPWAISGNRSEAPRLLIISPPPASASESGLPNVTRIIVIALSSAAAVSVALTIVVIKRRSICTYCCGCEYVSFLPLASDQLLHKS